MNIYAEQISDSHFEELINHGFVRLPPFSEYCDLSSIHNYIMSDEFTKKSFTEGTAVQASLIKKLGINDILASKLYQLATSKFGYKGSKEDQYHVARYVTPGNSKECYRTHFDSHIFTLVLPIIIPNKPEFGSGELVLSPNHRSFPKNELVNFFGKLYNKRYATRHSVTTMAERGDYIVESFSSLRPLLFIGMTTLHTNFEVSTEASGPRLTFLSHFFDPSPGPGIGSLLRALRSR